jgi:hypothetical protein
MRGLVGNRSWDANFPKSRGSAATKGDNSYLWDACRFLSIAALCGVSHDGRS